MREAEAFHWGTRIYQVRKNRGIQRVRGGLLRMGDRVSRWDGKRWGWRGRLGMCPKTWNFIQRPGGATSGFWAKKPLTDHSGISQGTWGLHCYSLWENPLWKSWFEGWKTLQRNKYSIFAWIPFHLTWNICSVWAIYRSFIKLCFLCLTMFLKSDQEIIPSKIFPLSCILFFL